jgi:hypothetical protein
MKAIKNKTVVLITVLVVVLLCVVLLATKCGKQEGDEGKGHSGSNEPEKEVIIDDKEDENGLTVGTPEDADKEQEENKVDFVSPQGTSDSTNNKNNTNSNDSTSNSSDIKDKTDKNENNKNETDKDETDKDETDTDKTEEDKNSGDLNGENDSTGQYGDFF